MKTLIIFALIGFSHLAFCQNQSKVSFIFLQDQTEGVIDDVNIDIALDWNDLSKTRVLGTAEVASLNTGNKMRDKHLKSDDYFNAEKYPVMKFECVAFEKSGDTYLAKGNLTIKNTTRKVEFLVEATEFSIVWTSTIDAADFDIQVKKGEGKNKVKVQVEVPISK